MHTMPETAMNMRAYCDFFFSPPNYKMDERWNNFPLATNCSRVARNGANQRSRVFAQQYDHQSEVSKPVTERMIVIPGAVAQTKSSFVNSRRMVQNFMATPDYRQ
jgi:hypothetical protein